MRIAGVESTDLFVGTAQRPLQVIRVTLENDGPASAPDGAATVYVQGPGVRDPGPFGITGLNLGERKDFEIPVEITAPYQPGSTRRVTVTVETELGAYPGRGGHHRGRAGLDDVDGQPLPLRPGVVEHPGPVRRGPAQPARRGRPDARRQGRLRAGRRAPGQGQEGRRLQVRAGRDRLPEAVFRRLPAGPGGPAAADGRRPGGDRRRQLQRAEHQPDRPRSHHPQRRLRDRIPAGRVRRRPEIGVDARRVRA